MPIIYGAAAVIRFLIYLAGAYQIYQTYQELIDHVPGDQPGERNGNGEDGWKETYFDPIPAAITGGFGILAAVLLIAVLAGRKGGKK